MRAFIVAFVLLPLSTLADEVRIAVGQRRDDAVALIVTNGGTDITSSLELEGPKAEHPVTGVFWALKDYNTIVSLAAKDGKITAMTFWTQTNFWESKIHRAKTEQPITELKFDTKTKGGVLIETPGHTWLQTQPLHLEAIRGFLKPDLTNVQARQLLGDPYRPVSGGMGGIDMLWKLDDGNVLYCTFRSGQLIRARILKEGRTVEDIIDQKPR